MDLSWRSPKAKPIVRPAATEEKDETTERPSTTLGVVSHKDSEMRAQAYAANIRLKFERVYESARRAIASGDVETALIKCQAAFELLKEKNIYGDRQEKLLKMLEDQIDILTRQACKP